MSPLSLDDAEMDQVMSACAPLPPERRDAFLQAIAAELAGCPEIGPGSVHRAIGATQRRFYDAPNLTGNAGVPRLYPRQARRVETPTMAGTKSTSGHYRDAQKPSH